MLLLRYSGLRLSQALLSSSDRVLVSLGCNQAVLSKSYVYLMFISCCFGCPILVGTFDVGINEIHINCDATLKHSEALVAVLPGSCTIVLLIFCEFGCMPLYLD